MKKIVDIEKWKEFVKDNIEALYRENFYYAKGYEAALVDATALLDDMPDAEEKHGKWIKVSERPKSIIFRCSLCGREAYKYIQEYSYPYCPNCGAKMEI